MALTYEPITSTTVGGSGTSTITFNSIPATYTDLRLVATGYLATGADGLIVTINGDTNSNYSWTYLFGDGSSASSSRGSNLNATARIGYFGTSQGTLKTDLMNYSNTTTYKTWLNRSSIANWGDITIVGLWRSTSAINSLSITSATSYTIQAGATFTLYGIKAA